MVGHDVIVIGASAGGVETLSRLVRDLPADLPAAVFVVLHLPANGLSMLPQILSRAGALPAVHPANGDPIVAGRIYVAPPDHHLLVKPGAITLARGPRENGVRPAVDPLFRTAARAYGPRVVGVVLSGTLDDGTAGLLAVKQRGGVAVVQDPEDALFAGMPRSAVENVAVDHCLPLDGLAGVLVRLAHAPARGEGVREVDPNLAIESDMAELDLAALQAIERPGEPSVYTCPECHGTLFELRDEGMTRFRCRVGHAYSPDSLLADQNTALEAALWTALRSLEEKAALADRLVGRARQSGHELAAARFDEQMRDAKENAALIREVLLHSRATDTAAADQSAEIG